MLPAPLKEADFLKAFVVIAVSSVFAGAVLGGFLGVIGGFIMGAAGVALPTIRLVCSVVCALAGVVCSYVLFRTIVLHFIVGRLALAGGQAV